MLFAGGEKAVECQSIFADMRVDEKSDFGVKFTEGGKGGKRNGDEIANTGDIENDLIGTFFEEAATEESDHRMKVLLRWEEVSTRRKIYVERQERELTETPLGEIPGN
jgi:hypothetical protein